MDEEKLKLSNQALGTLMMSLQKCLMEQTDITEILKELDFYVSADDEIVCYNPPTVEFDNDDEYEYYDEYEDEEEEQVFSIPTVSDNASIPWNSNVDEELTTEQEEEAQREYLEGWEFPDDDDRP